MVTVTTEDPMKDETPLRAEDARTLRFLKILVSVLTVTMIGGVLTITALLVIRLQTPAAPPQLPQLPDEITLPDGARATAFTQGTGWYAVVTEDDRILIFKRPGGELVQVVFILEE